MRPDSDILVQVLNHVPEYDEWAAYCFEQGRSDFWETSDDTKDVIDGRWQRFTDIPDRTVVEYCIRLFSSPEFVAETYSDRQISDGVWFIFGVGSICTHSFSDSSIPVDRRLMAIRSVATMYTRLFDRVCNRRGAEPDIDATDDGWVDGAVYMIWDMGGIDVVLRASEGDERVVDAIFYVLESALFGCRCATCKHGALHGLGHVADDYPDRAVGMIDRYLALPSEPAHLQEYAQRAREGNIQ